MRLVLLSNTNFDEEYAFNTLKHIIKPGMRVVCIPFASDIIWQLQEASGALAYHGEFWKSQYKPFREYGIQEGNFHVVTIKDNIEFTKWKIHNADILYFSGGQMGNIKTVLEGLSLYDFILEQTDKVMIGVSAGALIMQDEYLELPYIDDYYKWYDAEEGFGFVDTYSLMVHYNPDNHLHRDNLEYMRYNVGDKEPVALTDDGGIVIVDDFVIGIGNIYG